MYALGQQRTTVGDTVRSWPLCPQDPVLPYSLSRIRYEHAHLHPADRQRRFGTQVVSKSSVSWSTRGSPGMHPQHASRVIRFLRGGMEVGMEHMPKPDRHESIMTAALGRPARRPRASFLTGRLPIAHTPTVPASGGWTPVRVAGGADAVGGVQGPANE